MQSCGTYEKRGRRVPLVYQASPHNPFRSTGPLWVVCFRYCLRICDRSTRWSEEIPLKDISAQYCAKALCRESISHFVVPVVITTDQGIQFGPFFSRSWANSSAPNAIGQSRVTRSQMRYLKDGPGHWKPTLFGRKSRHLLYWAPGIYCKSDKAGITWDFPVTLYAILGRALTLLDCCICWKMKPLHRERHGGHTQGSRFRGSQYFRLNIGGTIKAVCRSPEPGGGVLWRSEQLTWRTREIVNEPAMTSKNNFW